MTTKRGTSSCTLPRQGALAALIATGFLVISGSLTGCAQSQAAKKEKNFTGREIAAQRLEGRALRSNPIVQRFLGYQIARGRDLGLEGVRAAKLGAVTIVWEEGVEIDRVGNRRGRRRRRYRRRTAPNHGQDGAAVSTIPPRRGRTQEREGGHRSRNGLHHDRGRWEQSHVVF